MFKTNSHPFYFEEKQEQKAMFELDKTLELNHPTLTWIDRTYRTERGLRRFLATLTQAQLAEAEVMVDDDTFVVFYPVALPVKKSHPIVFHFDLEGQSDLVQTSPEYLMRASAQALPETERVAAFNIVLAGVRLQTNAC